MTNRASTIKREKRKSFYMREIAQLLQRAASDEPRLVSLNVTRVDFSPGDGACYIYFTCIGGQTVFDELLDVMKLYRSSFRAALARARQSRYTPEIFFAYDQELDEASTLEALLDRVKEQEEIPEDSVE